jgi:hypothetical protein
MHPNINNDRKKDVSIFEKSNPGPGLAFTELLTNIGNLITIAVMTFQVLLRKYRKKFVPCVNKLFTCVLSTFE